MGAKPKVTEAAGKSEDGRIAEREIVTSRLLDAPRELVWKAWTDPEHVGKWWGPRGFTTTTRELDVRPGGVWRYIMHGPDGVDYPNKVHFIDILKPERLVYVLEGDDINDTVRFHTTITFEDREGKTLLTMRALFESASEHKRVEEKYAAIEGARQTLERLAEHLSSMAFQHQVLITREFDAPRALVFKAWTEPDRLVRWFAPTGCTIQFRKIDPREGGEFHSCIHTPDGHDCWCKGIYREVLAPERIVFTMVSADEKGNAVEPVDVGMDPEWPRETVVTVTFEDLGGKTKLTLHQTVQETIANRTGAHPSWLSMLDRLAEELTNH